MHISCSSNEGLIFQEAAERKNVAMIKQSYSRLKRNVAEGLLVMKTWLIFMNISWIYSMLGLVYKVLMVFMKYSEY